MLKTSSKSKERVIKKNSPPPKKVKCFQCQTKFFIKYIVPRSAYSQKNDWYHWTDKLENKGKYICDACLWKLYHGRKVYWETITSLKKRVKLCTYIRNGTVANKNLC